MTLIHRDDDPENLARSVTPQSGRYLLRVSGPDFGYYNYVERYVEIPADALEATITGFLVMRTEEPSDGMIYDSAYIQLRIEEPATVVSQTAPVWTNLIPASDWTPFSQTVDVTPYAGMELVFRIVGDPDDGIATYFYFDTVSMSVTRCRP